LHRVQFDDPPVSPMQSCSRYADTPHKHTHTHTPHHTHTCAHVRAYVYTCVHMHTHTHPNKCSSTGWACRGTDSSSTCFVCLLAGLVDKVGYLQGEGCSSGRREFAHWSSAPLSQHGHDVVQHGALPKVFPNTPELAHVCSSFPLQLIARPPLQARVFAQTSLDITCVFMPVCGTTADNAVLHASPLQFPCCGCTLAMLLLIYCNGLTTASDGQL
jgi:hypothetical protein